MKWVANRETVQAAIARTSRHIADMNNRRGDYRVLVNAFKASKPAGGVGTYVDGERARLKVLEGLL